MTGSGTMSWQKAVAELAAERGRAETAAAVIRRLGDAGAVAMAELTYGEGKAEADAVIDAFTIALAEGRGLDDRAGLEARLGRAAAARAALGQQATELARAEATEKGVVLDLLKDVLPDLMTALGVLWTRWSEGEAHLRETIAARLEAARWPPFATTGEP